MNVRLFVPLAVIASAPTLAASDVSDLQAQGIEFLASMTSTRFDAINMTTQPLLLRFRAPSTGASSTVVIPGLAGVEYHFAAGAADGLTLELTSVVDGLTRTTHALPLNALSDPNRDAMWVHRHDGELHAFAQVGTAFEQIGQGAQGGTETVCVPALHVPEQSIIDMQPPSGLPKKLESWVPPA
jgi:hypothetical protein